MNRFKHPINSREQEKGVALLTVLVSILIMSLLTIEFQYSVAIERKLAYSDLNQLQAHYLAKSGVNFGLLRIALFARANKEASKSGSNFALAKQFLPAIWNLALPPFPPTQSTLKKLTKADKDAAEKAVEETKISTGQFSQTISSESSKINLNFLIAEPPKCNLSSSLNLAATTPAASLCEYVARLLFNTIEDIFKKSENPVEEFGNYRAQEIVFDIMDWINPDEITFGSSNKDAFYEQQNPPYKAKRWRFFTIDELRLVRSVESNLFKKLKPLITVYAEDGKINLNEASKDVIKSIFPDFTDDDLKKIMEQKTKIGSWPSEADFVNFVTQTLGRSGFTTMYPDPKVYPFTVNTLSFVVESTGSVAKSKYNVQRKIKVAVVLKATSGAMKKSSATNQADCKPDTEFFWHPDIGQCLGRPTNENECKQLGQWVMSPPACNIQTYNGPLSVTPPTNTGPQEPNAMKILYWMET